MTDPLALHDIKVEDVPSFGLTGKVGMQKRLTFYAGSHGPFYRTYDAAAVTTQKMLEDMNSQVQQLRLLEGPVEG